MIQTDFVGDAQTLAQKPFKDIRSTRPSVAEEKAELVLTLGKLCRIVPACVRSGSVQLTRDWMEVQKAGRKIAANSRAGVNELQIAIGNFRRFE